MLLGSVKLPGRRPHLIAGKAACLAILLAITLAPALQAAGHAKYFVLVVWDGMRPDYVSAELTPTLHALRGSGVWFANHHSVYPTSTEVNGTVLATGAFPRRNGITANKEYRPEIDPLKQIGMESLPAVRRGDEVSGGKYVKLPTLAEMVQAGGGLTAVAGSKGVALLHDRLPRDASSTNPVWFATGCMPEGLNETLVKRLGAFPAAASPNTARDEWTTRCLTEVFWEKQMPRYSVLWLSEPDYSQHRHGPGSSEALASIRSCDQRLATVLTELDRRGIRAQTDVMVVSDHGFSTIAEVGDIAATLKSAGINAQAEWETPPKQDDVVSVGNGGSVLLYVTGKSETLIKKIVSLLQQRQTSGVIFTHSGLHGTFPLSAAMLDSPTAPDVIVSSSWKTTAVVDGHPSVQVTNDGYKEYNSGGGMHVTLSPTDLHNMAVAAGPDFRRGFTSQLPSGNVDVVPTLLWLMGIKPSLSRDGRVLIESVLGEAGPWPEARPGHNEARNVYDGGTWDQYLKFTEVKGVRYLEEGNGRWSPREQPIRHGP
jgi:arylsulfatase A-like enzyme